MRERRSDETKSQNFQKEEEEIIMEGDTVDISHLLFTKDRDFLVNRDGIKVTMDELKGKVLIIHVIPLLYPCQKPRTIRPLIETYNQLKGTVTKNGGFEVVIVATADDDYLSSISRFTCHTSGTTSQLAEERFKQVLQDMPFLAIPFHDRHARERVGTRLGVSAFALIDSSGKLLAKDVSYVIEEYGPDGFPFSNERIGEIYYEEEEAYQKPSLESLLATANRNFLIDNEGSMVPIDTLRHKVVGLYFFDNDPRIPPPEILMEAYEKLKSQHQDFEIVIVYQLFDDHNEKSFWQSFKTMPWLALPFKDPMCKKLSRIFEYNPLNSPCPDNSLVIIGPYGSYVEPYGIDILERYGIDAYPFTRERATKIESTSLMQLKLDSLFGTEAVFSRNDQTKIHVGELCRKRVLVLLAKKVECFELSLFLMMLRQVYQQIKGKGEEFEVIYVGFDETCYEDCIIQEIPWLVHPLSQMLAKNIANRIFRYGLTSTAVVAFEKDGKLMAIENNALSKTTWNDAFPYIDTDLEKHTFRDLLGAYDWHYSYDYDQLKALGIDHLF